MNEKELWETAVRRVAQAAGAAAPDWLARHGLDRPPASFAPEAAGAAQLVEASQRIAAHGRLLETGLAEGLESDWFLHPGRGLRMREVYELAVLLLAPPDRHALRAGASTGETRHALALALNLVCKTLDIPLGAVALDRLDLYAWRPRRREWVRPFFLKPGRKPGRLERWLSGRRP